MLSFIRLSWATHGVYNPFAEEGCCLMAHYWSSLCRSSFGGSCRAVLIAGCAKYRVAWLEISFPRCFCYYHTPPIAKLAHSVILLARVLIIAERLRISHVQGTTTVTTILWLFWFSAQLTCSSSRQLSVRWSRTSLAYGTEKINSCDPKLDKLDLGSFSQMFRGDLQYKEE